MYFCDSIYLSEYLGLDILGWQIKSLFQKYMNNLYAHNYESAL